MSSKMRSLLIIQSEMTDSRGKGDRQQKWLMDALLQNSFLTSSHCLSLPLPIVVLEIIFFVSTLDYLRGW